MFVHVLPPVHTALAVVALICGIQLLQYPNSHRLDETDISILQINSAASGTRQARPLAIYYKGVDGYDFNVGPEGTTNTPSTKLPSNNANLPPIATPFLLAAIELAVLAFTYGVKSLHKTQAEVNLHPPSHVSITESGTSFLLLFSPLLALCSSAQYMIWSPSVQNQSSGAATISLFLLLRALSLLVLSKFTPGLKRLFLRLPTSNWVSTAIALISLCGMNPLAFSFKVAGSNGFDGVPGYGFLVSCALLSPIGSWVNDAAVSKGGVRHFHLSMQALAASLCTFFVSLGIENVSCTRKAVSHLVMFAVVSLLSSGSRTLIPSSSSIIAVEVLRDQTCIVLAWILGLSDSSSSILKIGFLVFATVVILIPRSSGLQTWSEYGFLQDSETEPLSSDLDERDKAPQSQYVSYILFAIFSMVSMSVGLCLERSPSLIHKDTRNNIMGLMTVPSFQRKSASSMQSSGDGVKHQHVSIEPSRVVKRIISVSLEADLTLSTFEVSKSKLARPFAVNAVQCRNSSREFNLHDARIPPLHYLPRRKWDPKEETELPNHVLDLTFDHVQIGMLSAAKEFSKVAFSAQTFGANPNIHWTVFIPGDTDPVAEVGDHSFYLESIKRVTGRYPVVMDGTPATVFFKMVPYLFEQAPSSTRWFFVCGDETLIFPNMLLNILRLIPDDPLNKSMYVGDVPDTNRRANELGWDMASGGGGVLVSRHLAERIYKQYQWCLDNSNDDHGDGILRTCIYKATKEDGLGQVTLSRIPAFHSGDLFRGRDHEYTSQRSEAPGSARITALKLLSAQLSRTPCATLFSATGMPSLFQGMSHSHIASFDFWHLIHPIPLVARFRRFFIHLDDGRTAVVTFGLHVRVYRTGIKSLEHATDWDGDINGDAGYVTDEYLLDHSPNTFTRIDYIDYWPLHHANNTLVFSTNLNTHQFHLKCKFNGNNILSMCSES